MSSFEGAAQVTAGPNGAASHAEAVMAPGMRGGAVHGKVPTLYIEIGAFLG